MVCVGLELTWSGTVEFEPQRLAVSFAKVSAANYYTSVLTKPNALRCVIFRPNMGSSGFMLIAS